MVLIGRQKAFAEYRNHQALEALIQLLFEKNQTIAAPKELHNTEDIVTAILASIQRNDEPQFRDAISELEKRGISEHTQWIYDDLTIFSMVIGNLKFGGHNEIIEKILTTRKSNLDQRSLDITQSLIALNNQQANGPVLPIVITGQWLTNKTPQPNQHVLEQAFQQATSLEIDESTTPLLRILGEKVADIVVSMCVHSNSTKYYAFTKFHKNFDLRARIFGILGFSIIFLSTSIIWVYLVWQYFLGDKASSEFANKMFGIGVVLAPVTIFIIREKIYKSIRALFYYLFGGKPWLEYEKKSENKKNH